MVVDRDDELRQFIRQVLGCGCPDEVLASIRRQYIEDQCRGYERVDVGGRLLLYLLSSAAVSPDEEQLCLLLDRGRHERDQLGWHRFRLVVGVARDLEQTRRSAEEALSSLQPPADDRIHIHVVMADALPRAARQTARRGS